MKHSYSTRILSRRLTACIALIALPLTASTTYAQGSGTVTPGGVQPHLEKRSLPTAPQQPAYDIPAVPDRPLNADDGDKVQVDRFRLEGAESIEDGKVSLLELNKVLEKIRKSRPDGFTIGQLQQVANEITQYYRQQGYILAQAFIPQQKITDNVVVISLLSGKLGQNTTSGNDYYSDELIQWHFEDLVGQAIEAGEIESALLSLNDIPGLEAYGVFKPGQHIGETELVIKTKREKPINFVVIADNYGVETTGNNRLIASLAWNNPTGNGDRLIVTALQTFDPDDSSYGAFSYEIPVFTPAISLGVAYNLNDYAISQALDIPDTEGDTEAASIYGSYSFVRSRSLNMSATLDFSRKKANVEFKDFDFDLGEDNLSVVSGEFDFDSVDTLIGAAITEGSFSVHKGLADFAGAMDSNGDNNSLRQGGSGEYAGGDFLKYAFDLTRLQLINGSNSLLIRLEGQYSDDLLTSIEQYSMGGPNSVRAYPVSEYVRDKALFASLEWVINAPGFSDKPAFAGRNWGEVFQVSFFVDYAEGRQNDPRSFENKEENISGAGIGLELNLSEAFFIRFEAATPLSDQDASNGDNPQYWLSAGFEI